MARGIAVLFVITLSLVLGSVLFGRGESPKTEYFDEWLFLMPQNMVVRIPEGCMRESYESYYNPMEQYLRCTNMGENVRAIYVSLENSVVDYVSFRPHNLRYGDLIAIYGQPTNINIVRGRISSIDFDSIFVVIDDRLSPIDYETRVLTIGFTEAFRRNR